MSKQHPTVLYVGSAQNAAALHHLTDSDQWMVYHPSEMMEALAMSVFYYPDVVVIEDSAENPDAYEVFMHLHSINFEDFILLSDEPGTWELPVTLNVRVLPLNCGTHALAELISGAVTTRGTLPVL